MENNTPQVIADTYKIIGEIGSGGGGIVYLAEHLRLNKKVVLKADKRNLSTKPEILRREVDSLKNLSHTCIPQVYDFIVEDGTVFTVMDYIEGESFDKILKRGERFTQAQTIEWACQLLEALIYLHSRPPHGILHADIKPANVMLTPGGDVRLIDFNIALALGEKGAVAVGRSFGYASPEHYALDYFVGNAMQKTATDIATDLSGNSVSYVETVLQTKPDSNCDKSTKEKKKIMLDVRSDIYSLGATLYHIMTGIRPAQLATEVVPMPTKEFSPAVIAIIAKAMNPNVNLRYQSAQEMLYAFEHLREDDKRTKRYKTTTSVTIMFLSLLFLIGGFTVFVGLKQMEGLKNSYVLAEYSENALHKGDIVSAIDYALEALPEKKNIFTPPDTAEAQKALTDALNVYDLSDGFKMHKIVSLPSAPLYIQISPSGKTAAAVYAYNVAIFDTNTAEIIATLPAEHSALSEIEFLDENTIVYAGINGIKAYDIPKEMELWTGKPATAIVVSGNGKTVAAVYKDAEYAVIYDAASGQVVQELSFEGKCQQVTVNDSFANPNDNILALNHDGSLLGVSFADGSLCVYNLNDRDNDIELFDNTSGYTHFEGGFYQQYFAFTATNHHGSAFAVIDTVGLVQTGGFESVTPFAVKTDKNGIYVKNDNLLVKIHPVTGEQTALVTTAENITQFAHNGNFTLITTKDEYAFFDKNAESVAKYTKEYNSDFTEISDGIALIGSLDAPVIQIMKLENHSNAEILSYDPSYAHDESRISADGKTVMLFSYDKFRLYDINGEIIKDVTIPNAEQIYDQQYRRDQQGSRLEVIYNDGTILAYSAKDGNLMLETVGGKPDLTLYEEFFTDTFRIESPLHETPKVYDKATGEFVRELEKNDYLTYVTQVGEYIITEYITGNGNRYGLLLNSKCEILARLSCLCDIIGDELIFDYPTGHLRKSQIYNKSDLIRLVQEGRNEY